MADRDLLGPADVDDAELTRIVAAALHAPPEHTRVLSSRAESVAYDVPSITTAARTWVAGEAEVDGHRRPWRVFVKQVQCWSRSPWFRFVPDDMKEMAAASVPWRTEGLAYRSDLGDRLPAGLRMPHALAVHDLDERSHAIWLEAVEPADDATWDLPRHELAARLLGRLAASAEVAVRRDVGHSRFSIREHYLRGRLRAQVLPALHDPATWQHPLVAEPFAAVREELLEVAGRVEDLVDELESFPLLTSHGDACPNNLLVPADRDGFVLIDYGFFGPNPVGFDLGQLLVGDVQIGRRAARTLPDVEAVIVPAYVAGLGDEGLDLPVERVRRAHALQLMIFAGLSTIPFELLDQPPSDALRAVAAERATTARFSLDLLAETA